MTTDSTLPDPPSSQKLRTLGLQTGETRTIDVAEVWWRVHKTDGAHVMAWNALRTYGPLLRFDPRRLPAGEDPAGRGVWYGASTPDAALAEAFQITRTIDREHNRPYLTALSFNRTLIVLDVAADSDGKWIGLSSLDGLRYNSRFASAPCLALFTPAAPAMPARPTLSLPLTHPALATRIAGAAKRLGYAVV